jgi:hypothetical protein
MFSKLTAALIVGGFFLLRTLLTSGRRPPGLPPGPPTIPLFGNMHLVSPSISAMADRTDHSDSFQRHTFTVPKMGERVRANLLADAGLESTHYII